MTHKLEVATNAAATTWQDLTSVVDWDTATFGGHAFEVEVGADFGFDFNDDAGTISIPTRRVVRITENATASTTTMFRGRVTGTGVRRGALVTGNARDFDVRMADYNQDFRGIPVDKWSRPSENDRARLIALHAAFLSGSPRASTNMTFTYVPNLNNVTMAKKVYESTDPAGVFADCIEQSGKTAFVTVDGEIFSAVQSSTTYSSTIGITDVNPDYSTTFPPIRASASGEAEGGELYTGATLIKTDGSRISSANAAAETAHDYWRTVIHDDDVTRTTSLQALAAYVSEFSKDDVGYRCAIILPANRVDAIKWGMTINFRSAAAGVLSNIGVRIVRLQWRSLADGTYMAELELDYPMKVNPKRPRGGITAAAAIVTPLPGSVLQSGSVGLDPFDEAVRPVAVVAATPALPDGQYPEGATVHLTGDGKLYRNHGGVWVKDTDGADITAGTLGITPFASTIRPVAIVGSLPGLASATYPIGSTVVLTTDGKLYRNVANVWVKTVDGNDLIASSVIAGKIAAGAIGASEIAAGAVTADKVSVGARSSPSLVSNYSFEDGVIGGAIEGWTVGSAGAGLGYQENNASLVTDGVRGGTVYATSGASDDYAVLISTPFPVTAGEPLYMSAIYVSSNTANGHIFVQLHFLKIDGTDSATPDIYIVNAGNAVAAVKNYAKGYITVPSDAYSAQARVWNYNPSVSTYVTYDQIIVQRMTGGVINSTAETIIDAAGITVINGKITVANAGAVVIIDGTSNMFKIAATGTQTITGCNGGAVACTATQTVTIATGLTYPPAHQSYLETVAGKSDSLPRVVHDNSIGAAGSGHIVHGIRMFSEVVSTNQTQLSILWETRTNSSALTYTVRYYVMVERAV